MLRELDLEQSLGDLKVPFGRFTYNVYDDKEVQAMDVLAPLEAIALATTRIAVRVNSN